MIEVENPYILIHGEAVSYGRCYPYRRSPVGPAAIIAEVEEAPPPWSSPGCGRLGWRQGAGLKRSPQAMPRTSPS
jgi:hypothetical protein